MYKVAFDKDAEREFLKLDSQAQKLVSLKIFGSNPNFSSLLNLVRIKFGFFLCISTIVNILQIR